MLLRCQYIAFSIKDCSLEFHGHQKTLLHSVPWTYAFINTHWRIYFFFPAVIDIILLWKARKTMQLYVKIRYVLKVISAAAWVIILPVTYAYSWKNPPGLGQTIKKWFGNSPSSPSLFIMAILIYLSPNILSTLLFVFPFIRRILERSNNKIVLFLMWWSQVYKSLL